MSISENQPESKILSPKEVRRYALQINAPEIGLEGQEKIKQARVLVIGAGGKGTSVLQNLASVGVGKIGISDNFPVQESELSRQHLYGNSDLGKQKAIISKQKLVEINHLVDYMLHNVFLNENNIDGICKDYDILVDATDNYPTHYLIDLAAIRLRKPLIFGKLNNTTGLVTVLNYKNGPSLKCLYPKAPEIEKQNLLSGFACQVSLMSIIGAIIANETLKVILGLDTLLSGNLMKFDSGSYSCSFEPIIRKPENFK